MLSVERPRARQRRSPGTSAGRFVALALLVSTGCASLGSNASYRSDLKLPRMNAALELKVTTWSPGIALPDEGQAELRRTFEQALREDLDRNGPLSIATQDGAGVLHVQINELRKDQAYSCGYFSTFSPIMCLFTPTDSSQPVLGVRVQVWNTAGGLVTEFTTGLSNRSARTTVWMLGSAKTIDLESTARRVAELVRIQLDRQKSTILQGLAGGGPTAKPRPGADPSPAKPPEQQGPSRPAWWQ